MTKKELLEQIKALDPEAAVSLAKATKAELVAWIDEQITGEYEPDLDENGNEIPLDEEDNEPKSMSRTLNKYRTGYEPTVAYSGRVSLNTGDDVAVLLAGLAPDAVIRVAEQLLGLEDGELMTRYAGLNPGQRRMNGGNRIRAAIKRGDATVDDLKAVL